MFAVSEKANELIRLSFKFSELRALMKQQVAFISVFVWESGHCDTLSQEFCKGLCDEINGIRATFPVFEEIAKAEMPKGTSSAEQLIKLKKFFAKAIDPSQDKIQMQERKSRILKTSDIVQVRAPVRTISTLTLTNCGYRPFCPIIWSRCESTFCDGRPFTVSAHKTFILHIFCLFRKFVRKSTLLAQMPTWCSFLKT